LKIWKTRKFSITTYYKRILCRNIQSKELMSGEVEKLAQRLKKYQPEDEKEKMS
jgi:hypothetical protein